MAEPTPDAKSPDAPATPALPHAPGAKADAPAAHGAGDHKEHGGKGAAKAAAAAKLAAAMRAVQLALSSIPNFFKNFRTNIVDAGKALISFPQLIYKGDSLTRVLLVGFVASVLLLVFTGRLLYVRFGPKYAATQRVEKNPEEERAEQQKKLQILAENVVFLEHFEGTLATKSEPDSEGAQHPYEMELYVETDSPETSKAVKAHLNDVREMVVFASRGLILEDVQTEGGKEQWRARIVAAIDKGIKHWAPESKIKRVYFTRLLLDASLR